MIRCREAYLNAGSRTGGRDTFFCSAKRKYPKKKPPERRFDPALRSFRRRLTKGASCPFVNAPHLCGAPSGLIPPKALVLGAAYGENPTHRKFFTLTLCGWVGAIAETQHDAFRIEVISGFALKT